MSGCGQGQSRIAEVDMVGRGALREYMRGSLWVLPSLSVLAALAAGAALSSVRAGPRSPLAFQGTPDDARTLLLGITGTMVTVIALLLGLTVVALQLSSTQFSPRLLRSFLRDRPNQVVLSAFVATFAYSAAGLYTVGVSGGNRTAAFPRLADSGVRIGFERTLEQDAAFGIRQLVDVACKALSPAVNDPYTAVQAVDHLSVIFCALARRPLGTHVARDGQGIVIVPARRFGDYLAVMCGLIRRYGAGEPTVAHALLRLLGNCAAVAGDDPGHGAAIGEQARLIVSDAEREVAQPADLDLTHAEAESVLQAVARPRPEPPG